MKRLLILLAAVALLAALGGCSKDENPMESVAGDRQPSPAAAAVPADAVVDSVHLYLHANATDSVTVQVHRVNGDWSEGAVTYNGFAAAYDLTPLTTVLVQDTGWYGIDITVEALGWFDNSVANYGFFMQTAGTDTAFASFDSRESAANQPYIQAFYTVHEGESMEMLEAAADAYIYSVEPDVNFGAAENLMVQRQPGVDSVSQSLIRFDFPIEIRYTSLGDRVWLDLNADGIQDVDEPGYADVTVNLYDCADTLLATTTTDEFGAYLFDSLVAGDYRLEFVAPANYLFSPMDVGDDAVDSDVDSTGLAVCVTTLPGVDYIDIDAGLYPAPASVGGFAWDDLNMNGLQDIDEPGMPGIEVVLSACGGDMVAGTMTDSLGMYVFDGLEAGEYFLEFVNPFGYIFTYQDEGDDEAIDSDVDRYQKVTVCFTLEPGDEITDWDAGLFAFDGCTYGKGYWKNHAGLGPQDDELSKLLPVWLGDEGGDKSLAVDNAEMAFSLLQQHQYGHPSNGITKLYAHLLTTKLNIVNFANAEEIQEAVADADAFLADNDWTDWDGLDKDTQKMVLMWKDRFEEYNEGEIGPGHCDDDDDDDDDTM